MGDGRAAIRVSTRRGVAVGWISSLPATARSAAVGRGVGVIVGVGDSVGVGGGGMATAVGVGMTSSASPPSLPDASRKAAAKSPTSRIAPPISKGHVPPIHLQVEIPSKRKPVQAKRRGSAARGLSNHLSVYLTGATANAVPYHTTNAVAALFTPGSHGAARQEPQTLALASAPGRRVSPTTLSCKVCLLRSHSGHSRSTSIPI